VVGIAQPYFWPQGSLGPFQKWRFAVALYLRNEDWRLIAEQASTEMDPKKLTLLIAHLCRALDGENDISPKQRQQINSAKPASDIAKP